MKILCSRQAFLFLKPQLTADVEEFWAIGLSSSKSTLAVTRLFRGTVDACLVHPRDIIRFACLNNASSILVAHNHPSNDPHPSREDLKLTLKIHKICQLVQIPLIDHLILTNDQYFSFADQQIPPFHPPFFK